MAAVNGTYNQRHQTDHQEDNRKAESRPRHRKWQSWRKVDTLPQYQGISNKNVQLRCHALGPCSHFYGDHYRYC